MSKVPQLRFPEFTREWEEKKFDELGQIERGKSKHRPRNDAKLFGGTYPFIQTSDIKAAGLILKEFTQTYSEFGLKQSKLWEKDTLCITIAANIAETSILGIAACFPDSVIGFNSYERETNNYFVKYYFEFLKQEFEKMAEGVAQSNLNLEKLKGLSINIPEIGEQQKIADFFTLLDQKIEKQKQKIEHLERYKKGIMQQLFSRTIRFKDENGDEYPKWAEFVLGELGETFTGLSGKTKDDFGHGEAKFITYMNVFKNINASEELTEFVDVKPSETQNHVIKGDILFTTSSETPVEVGMASVWMYESVNMYLNSFCFGFRTNVEIVNPVFLTYQLRSQEIRKKISTLGQGSTRYNISKTGLMKMSVQIPCLEEQEKIVRTLSQQEVKIEKEMDKLNRLVNFKKGLMQKLFV